MQKNNGSMSSGVIAFLAAVMFFLVSWLWIMPQYRQGQADLARVTYEVNAAKEKLTSLQSAQSTLDSLGGTFDSMLVAVPKDQDSGNIITTLEAIATANKTYIPSFQIGGTSASAASSVSSTVGTVPVVFSTTGTFESLNTFVKAIESNLKFFNIRTISVSSSDSGISMTIQLDAYTQRNISSLSS